MAAQFDPGGRPIYFRVVTTSTYQGPNMANYLAQQLKVKKVYILDDSGSYGVGMSNAFEAQAKKLGVEVVGHDQLNPTELSYVPLVTKIKALAVDAMYYGGSQLTAIKLAKQAYDVVPDIIKAGGDAKALQHRAVEGAGFPAMQELVRDDRGALHRREPVGAALDRAVHQEIRPRAVILCIHRV